MAVSGQRSDAVRSRARLLEAARAAFAEHGVSVPAKIVTDAAGLGVGTLYRHFPRRSDLILAVLDQEIRRCVDDGERLRAAHGPVEALRRWLESYAALVSTKHGLADALHSADPAYADLPARIWKELLPVAGALLHDGVAAGKLRDALSPRDLLTAVALLCQDAPGREGGFTGRVVAVLIAGLVIDGAA